MNENRNDPVKQAEPLSRTEFPSEAAEKATFQYQKACQAKRYVSHVLDTRTDKREQKCVELSLSVANITSGSSVLDCPCGPGRLIPMLKKHGFKITAADVSPSMVEYARKYTGPDGTNCLAENDNICVANLFSTGFENKQFDAVLCHRVFQYFSHPQERLSALNELRRISKGPVIISFLCNWSLDAIWYYVRRFFNVTRKRKCKPISPTTFDKDIRNAGFQVKTWIAMRPFISKRWYAVLEPARNNAGTCASNITAYKRIIFSGAVRIAAAIAVACSLVGYFYLTSIPVLDNGYHVAKMLKEYDDGDEAFYASSSSTALLHEAQILKPTNPNVITEQVAADQRNKIDSFFLLSLADMQRLRLSPTAPKLSLVKKIKIGSELFSLLRTPDLD